MKIDAHVPIASLAAELPGAMAVFEAMGLDYSCAGNRSLEDAAYAEGIVPEAVVERLRRLERVRATPEGRERSLAEISAYLTRQHRAILRLLGRISTRLGSSCDAPRAVPRELLSLREVFERLSAIVLPHMHREDSSVFPAIQAVERGTRTARDGALRPMLSEMLGDHAAVAAELRTVRELRIGLEDADAPDVQTILEDLRALEAQLHEAMFLENCVLFPRALALG
jgi:regulator of cell morphogenesis and NO signaling